MLTADRYCPSVFIGRTLNPNLLDQPVGADVVWAQCQQLERSGLGFLFVRVLTMLHGAAAATHLMLFGL